MKQPKIIIIFSKNFVKNYKWLTNRRSVLISGGSNNRAILSIKTNKAIITKKRPFINPDKTSTRPKPYE